MVGVLAESATLEDYIAQPCKKQRKEEDPQSKTITNYFSPLSKAMDKGLSSPRSHTIADYFIRSPAAAGREHTPSDKATSPVCRARSSKDSPSTPLTGTSKPVGKMARQGKRTRLIKRLSDLAPTASGNGGRIPGNSGTMGSDTAALIAEVCSQAADLEYDFQAEASSAIAKPRRRRRLTTASSEEAERPSTTSGESSSLEVHVDTSDHLGTSTISYEDFMKSQEKKHQPTSDVIDMTSTGDDDDEPAQLPLPKIVTVQAQVHLSQSQHLESKAKIASIFKTKKVGKKKVDASTPEHDQISPAGPKRRSNVVIQEEDHLELAVINIEAGDATKQKSTLAERQQFMKAFRQVGDPSKPSAKKNPARKKDCKEGTEDHHKPETEDLAPDEAVNEDGQADKAQKVRKKQPLTRPSLKTTKPSKAAAAKEEEQQSPPVPDSPVLRRSLRQKPYPFSKSPESTPAESPILMSTPKACPNNVYKAEVLTLQSDTESPIRMRFTRVTRRTRQQLDSDNDSFTTGFKKVSRSSKKISKAKQLLEKAKAIQQNIVKAETALPRRSIRQKRDATQDPIVIADTISSKKKTQSSTNLRSLNDVLGKKVKTRLPSGQKKETRKKVDKGGVITIDDGSEVSENSQDEEQFKAKREFLLSGLPDSLKRQIAKTTAMREAYFVSGSSFQTALHVQQRDNCTMWSLAMPCCSLLSDLAPLCSDVPDITHLAISLGDFTCVNSKSAIQEYPAPVFNRSVFSDVLRNCLLEEIQLTNPQFPVKTFFKQFLKKQSDYLSLQDANKSAPQQIEKCLKPAGDIRASNDSAVEETGTGTKRKRKPSPRTKSKRRKPALTTGDADEPECDSALTTRGQLTRSSLRKCGSMPVVPNAASPVSLAEDAFGEDILWTEKYQPQNSSELIGNSAAIRRLHSWLREWKIRAEKEEKRNQMQKTGKDKDESWSAFDFHDTEDNDEDSLCNTLLISGPPGVGKTAAVYACAQELGFKVFEVNASCQRSGRQILAQLKEATQSHQVDQQGVNAHKPCFFNNFGSSKSPRKQYSPKTVVSSPRKPPMSPRGPGLKKGLAPKSLSNFFKATPKQKHEVKKTNPELVKAPQTVSDGKTTDGKTSRPDKLRGAEETQRKTATSLILFEEVDVIFEDDTGFLSAIKTFMSTTKRPVILTTSDPTFGMMFDGTFEEISFHTPSVVNVASFLQVLCLAENLRTDTKDVITFLTANRCDIRQSVLQLQFWARSGGGGLREKPLPPPNKQKIEASDSASCKYPATDRRAAHVPGCNVGCTENLLGVNNIIASTDGLISFIKEKILADAEWEKILQLLTEFHTRSIYFTSTNLEFLLPLPVHVAEETAAPSTLENTELGPLPVDNSLRDTSLKRCTTVKRSRMLVEFDDSDLFESDSNSMDEVFTVGTKEPEEEESPCSNEVSEPRVVKRMLSPAELQSSLLVYECLDSMAEFADHMSSLDCYTCDMADPTQTCSPNWTVSRLKHGLCDGPRTESKDLWDTQSCAEMRALIEALSFRKCSSKLSKTLDASLALCKQSGKDPTEELTLCVSKAREQVYFGQPAATTDISGRRVSVIKDVLSHRAFIGLGNREVNVTEYLPTLRSICRLQKTKEEGKTKRRFLHYLEGIYLELPKATLRRLAADFP